MQYLKKVLRKGWLDALLIAIVSSFSLYIYYQLKSFAYVWDWEAALPYIIHYHPEKGYQAGTVIKGLLMTLKIALWASVLSIITGLLIAITRFSHVLFFKLIGWLYVQSIRNIPPLVFVFVFYFLLSSYLIPTIAINKWVSTLPIAVQQWISVIFEKPDLLENFISGVICLALFEAAYIAEIVRGGLQSIPKEQWDAAVAFGMNWWLQMRLVILPQAVQMVLPSLSGQLISLTKNSSILSVIAIQELTFATLEASVSSSRVFEVWIITAAIYFAICFVVSILFRRLEKRKLLQQK